MNDLKTRQNAEALERMVLLEFHPNVLYDFKNGVINRSENGGILYWLTDDEKKIVSDFEEKWNATVYHAIRNSYVYGDMLALLYVSQHDEEWSIDRQDLQNYEEYEMRNNPSQHIKAIRPYAYVYNFTCPEFSEIGSIGIVPQYGGLCRIF